MKMRIEPNGSGGRGKMSSESRKMKRRQKKTSAVQKLYEVCKEVFADSGPGVIPSPENVEKLSAVLDGMSEADVGLRPNMPFFSSECSPVITYLPLHECDKFSIGIFCLPPNKIIPLHNHPGMTVFSKLLFGTMHIRSLDWANDSTTTNVLDDVGGPEGSRLAKVKVNSELTAPCRTSILYPAHGGNMHRFTAKTACAVLDVLGPPYCDPEGRHCQYYLEFPLAQISAEKVSGTVENAAVVEVAKEGYTWLKERERPEDHVVKGVTYNGPKIVRK